MFLLSIRRAVILQLALIGAMLLAVWLWQGETAGGAALFGSLAALLNTLLLYWRWIKGSRQFHSDPTRHLTDFYRSSLERFFVVGIWLALGFTWLELPPLPLLTGFVAGQLAWLIASMALRERI